ncbi:PTI1-like tyrosine-protein kinase At3g15890 [Carica papaya]|uniref:PTI1-like tyrosine-protein kinase At3g15890 n=1 Tax=Carica papaya TaxID=3649 RepID=UPI000B8CECA3|nr:PTI1-like tyrosine-protein kinase At3g15890 [Carica papaya]
MLGKASESCDVYSFGILLLELASGKKPIEKLGAVTKRTITDWALPLVRGEKFSEIADARLNGNFVEEELKRIVLVALVCAHNQPEKRPTMLEVVELLKGESKEKLTEIENHELFKNPQPAESNNGKSDNEDCISEEKKPQEGPEKIVPAVAHNENEGLDVDSGT